jgi:hypothetical protein
VREFDLGNGYLLYSKINNHAKPLTFPHYHVSSHSRTKQLIKVWLPITLRPYQNHHFIVTSRSQVNWDSLSRELRRHLLRGGIMLLFILLSSRGISSSRVFLSGSTFLVVSQLQCALREYTTSYSRYVLLR